MSTIYKLICVALIVLLVGCATPHNFERNVEDSTSSGYVVRVIDGDTIIVNIDGKKERVRLIGVDTPETKHPKKPVQYLLNQYNSSCPSQELVH